MIIGAQYPIIIVTNVMLYTHNDRRILSTTPESIITLNDVHDTRTKELQSWYDAIRRSIEFKESSPSMCNVQEKDVCNG